MLVSDQKVVVYHTNTAGMQQENQTETKNSV